MIGDKWGLAALWQQMGKTKKKATAQSVRFDYFIDFWFQDAAFELLGYR